MSESKEELTAEQRAELIMLGERLAKVYGQKIKYYQDIYKAYPNDEYIQTQYSPDKIHDVVTEPITDNELATLRERPCSEIRWDDLHSLHNRDSSRAMKLWDGIQAAAADWLQSGNFACERVQANEKPWHRAEFKAIRRQFVEAWEPQGAIEAAMVDILAQSYMGMNYWLRVTGTMTSREFEAAEKDERDRYGSRAEWHTPRLNVAEAIDRAFTMVDRFNRMFLRTLRQMRDLRRYQMPVTINNPKQVNIAADGGQQVNLQAKNGRKKPLRTRSKLTSS